MPCSNSKANPLPSMFVLDYFEQPHTCSIGHNVEMAPNIGYVNPLHSSNVLSGDRDGVSHVGVWNVDLDVQVGDVLDSRVVRVVNLETIK